MSDPLQCQECGEEVEYEEGDEECFCPSCGSEVTKPAAGGDAKKYANFVIGEIKEATPVPKNKLTKVMVSIGKGEPVQIVTNAKSSQLVVGSRVVIALEGAIVPAGADPDGDEVTVVKKAAVGGVMSRGMLCDSVMLDWTGGSAGAVVRLDPKLFNVGDAPPAERPKTYKG